MRGMAQMWKASRDRAESEGKLVDGGYGVRYVISERDGTHGTRYGLTLWVGKRSTPECNYLCSSREDAEEFVRRHVKSARQSLDFHAQQEAEKVVRLADMRRALTVGTILVNQWGYDQTNTDFYQVVRRTKATAWLRPIGADSVPGSEAFMSCSYIPKRDDFMEGETMRKRIGPWGVSFKHGGCSIAEPGKRYYCSWYA